MIVDYTVAKGTHVLKGFIGYRSLLRRYNLELRAGMSLMANGIAVRLDSLAEVVGDSEFWWVTHLFVVPKSELMELNTHKFYVALHSFRRVA